MNNPAVSILIPAFRPDWLDTAIASALAQTHTDFELLISDDCPTDAVERVVAKWDDPRLRWFKNPQRGVHGSNRDHLLSQARGEFVKFLFDDDYLFPRSVEMLLSAMRNTDCKLAFHSRHFVDAEGRVLCSPQLVPSGEYAVMPSAYFFDRLIGECANPIGEPTNILVHAKTLRRLEAPFALNGQRTRFLTDVTLYANFAAQNLGIVGVGYFGSAFRQHVSQTSGTSNPGYSAGYFEWEFLRRWSVDAGQLDPSAFERGTPKQIHLYRQWAQQYPELEAFIALNGKAEADRYLSAQFCEILSLAYATIDMRKLVARH
jgi:glycosyltransferase involved in cell wall biosynthesis